jgi:hypothetical protein
MLTSIEEISLWALLILPMRVCHNGFPVLVSNATKFPLSSREKMTPPAERAILLRLHRKACVAADLACLVIDGRENSRASRKKSSTFGDSWQLYEIGYLPLSNLIWPRGVLVICRQRYEILDLFKSILRSGRFEQKAIAEVY